MTKMDAHVVYTKFPNLYSTEECRHQPATLLLEWPPALPQNALLLSWTALLQAYTGLPDPVFAFEGRAIQVDVALGCWTEVKAESTDENQCRQTSVTLNKVGLHVLEIEGARSDSFVAL